MIKVNLFGGSGHAKVISDIIRSQGDSVGVIYDDAPHCSELAEVPVLRASEYAVEGPMIISIGANEIRKKIAARYPVVYATAIASTAEISKSAHIGFGSVVMQGTIIQADVRIGNHCIINSGASIDHECLLEDYVHVSPHATLCGNVKVGEGSWIGAGATVIPGIQIGSWVNIGAGAVVVRDVPDGAVVAGVPAKILRFKEGYGEI